jgi:Platelet-activating factor acetylhydrolase, isoform II
MNRKPNAVADLRAVAVSRRRLLGGAAALAGGLAVTPWAGTALAAERTGRLRLTLPTPTGPYPIGTVSLHLVDHARQDPWWSTPHPRELMVTVWYPAHDVGPWPLAPWMSPGALAYHRTELEEFLSFSPDTPPDQPPTNTPVSLAGVDFPTTHARQGVPLARSAWPCPAVLFSPGYSWGREVGTVLVEDLASHGYVVVTMSYTYESWEVEFPGGRVERGRHDPDNDLTRDPYDAVRIRLADMRFVLDQLAALNAGHNPDAERRPLPAGLRHCLDLARIGVFGHSLGGATAAQAIALDSRVIAAVNLDGSMFPYDLSPLPPTTPEELDQGLVRLAERIGNKPFMIMGDGGRSPDEFGALTSVVWHHLRGWRRFVSLIGSTHGSYQDFEALFPQLAAAGVITAAAAWIGTLDPHRAIAAERAYIRAFFDLWLRDRDCHLLDGPSATYPEAKVWL